MSETEKKPLVNKVRMVFARNIRTATSDKIVQMWYVLGEGDVLPKKDDYVLYTDLAKKPFPGAVYDAQTSEDGKTSRVIGYASMFHDEEKRMEWATLHRGLMDNIAAEKREAKDRKDDPFEPLLVKLNREYFRLVGPARDIFLARCIAKITRGVKLS